jgi:hypothetical protein
VIVWRFLGPKETTQPEDLSPLLIALLYFYFPKGTHGVTAFEIQDTEILASQRPAQDTAAHSSADDNHIPEGAFGINWSVIIPVKHSFVLP